MNEQGEVYSHLNDLDCMRIELKKFQIKGCQEKNEIVYIPSNKSIINLSSGKVTVDQMDGEFTL